MTNEPLKLKKKMVLFVAGAFGIIVFSHPLLWAQLDVDASIDGVAFSNASVAELDQASVPETGMDASQMGNVLQAAALGAQEATLLAAGATPAGEGEAGGVNGDFNSQAGFIAMEMAVNLARETFGGNIPPAMQEHFNMMERNFSALAEMDRSMDPGAMAQMFALAFTDNISNPGQFSAMLEGMRNAPEGNVPGAGFDPNTAGNLSGGLGFDPLGGGFQFGSSTLFGDIGGPIGADIAANLPGGADNPFDASIVAQTIAQGINDFINQTSFEIRNQILNQLPPEALQTLAALNTDFAAADLTFLQNNPGQNIARAFSADIANSYEGNSYPGQEHIHVTYSLDSDGDLLFPASHVDANVTAIHDANHTVSVNLDTEGADHIPGIT